ncbi:MAG: hypothetical protein IJE84_01580, partial [Clostridia bacterium]|nr:hypothetical protein [Clostridia bacterium]
MPKLDISKITVKRILAVNRVNITHVHSSNRTNRECFAITVKTAGRTIYKSANKEYVSDPEHIVIIPKGASYKSCFEELGECYMIEFEADYDGEAPEIMSCQVSHNHDFVNKMISL